LTGIVSIHSKTLLELLLNISWWQLNVYVDHLHQSTEYTHLNHITAIEHGSPRSNTCIQEIKHSKCRMIQSNLVQSCTRPAKLEVETFSDCHDLTKWWRMWLITAISLQPVPSGRCQPGPSSSMNTSSSNQSCCSPINYIC
jgi:hypothetical protein